MLGILLIYFIGKRFYDLAEEFNQNKWVYAILSVVIYYALGTVFVFIVALLDIMVFEWGFDWESTYGMNLLIVPFGLLAVWGFYMLLENRWKRANPVIKDEIDDIGKQ